MLKEVIQSMVISSNILFIALSRRFVKALLLVVVIFVSLFQTFSFGLNIGRQLIYTAFQSICIAVIGYVVAYFLGGIMKYISTRVYKSKVEYFLFAPQLLLAGLFFIVIVESILLPNWKLNDVPFNPFLMLFVVYYSFGDISFHEGIFSSFKRSVYKINKYSPSERRMAFAVISIVILVMVMSKAYNTYELKSELYYLSLNEIKNNNDVRKMLGEDLRSSLYIKGEHSGDTKILQYNLKSSLGIAVVYVKRKYINGSWSIIRLTVEKPREVVKLNYDK